MHREDEFCSLGVQRDQAVSTKMQHTPPILWLHCMLPPQRFLRQTPSWEHVQLSTYGSSSSGLGVGAQSDIDMTLSLPAIRGAKQKAEVCGAGRKGLRATLPYNGF
jgi:hypothetical protein